MSKGKSNEQFVQEVFELVGQEYTILDVYKGAKTKIKMRHNSKNCDNYEWTTTPSNFLDGYRCPKCANNARKNSSIFCNEVYELVGDEYCVLGEYKNAKTKIRMRHNSDKCGFHEWNVEPNAFINGSRCPRCFGKIKKKHEDFLQEIKDLHGDDFVILNKYNGANNKIKIRHQTCNFEWETTPHSFLTGKGVCPKCSNLLQKTTDIFKNEVYRLVGEEYEVIGEYINSTTPILIRHNCNKCSNNEYLVKPNAFLCGKRCHVCAGNKKKSTTIFKKEVFDLVGDEYTVLSSYVNTDTKIQMKHNCGNCNNYVWDVTPANFLKGRRCPICNESKGENQIRTYCLQNNIIFSEQYSFCDLLSKLNNPLRFDFAVFNDNNKTQLKYLIEYDGEQHYRWIKSWITKKDFDTLQYHDKLKNQYCLDNNIILIRIPYSEFNNINEILSKELG